jgi:hypothetical protein
MIALSSKQGCFLLRPRSSAYIRALSWICHSIIWNPITAWIMAEELYHAFTVISGMRYRVVVIAEQRVQGRWVQMSTTELSTFSPRNRTPRMPSRPPPPPPPPAAAAAAAAAEDQVVPQGGPPEEPAQPSSDAPGPMRVDRRAREQRRRSLPPRPSQPPAARHGPPPHDVLVPA